MKTKIFATVLCISALFSSTAWCMEEEPQQNDYTKYLWKAAEVTTVGATAVGIAQAGYPGVVIPFTLAYGLFRLSTNGLDSILHNHSFPAEIFYGCIAAEGLTAGALFRFKTPDEVAPTAAGIYAICSAIRLKYLIHQHNKRFRQ